MNINDLPHHILGNIIEKCLSPGKCYSSNKELLKLTTVCKNFNYVIGNSHRLMDALIIRTGGHMQKAADKALAKSKRKYRKVQLSHKNHNFTSYLFKFLSNQPSITTLEFNGCTLKTIDLWMVIDLVKGSLGYLTFSQICFEDDDGGGMAPINMPNLKQVSIGSQVQSGRLIKLFENATSLKAFKHSTDVEDEDGTGISFELDEKMKYRNWLVKCEDLERLEVNFDLGSYLFYDTEFSEQAKCKLKTLRLGLFPFFSRSEKSILLFMSKQTALTELFLSRLNITDDLLELVLNMPCLKVLDLHGTHLNFKRDHSKSSTIETLRIEDAEFAWDNRNNTRYYSDDSWRGVKGVDYIISRCPSLCDLRVDLNASGENISEAIAGLARLEKLHVNFGCSEMRPLNFPSVRILTLKADIISAIHGKITYFDKTVRSILEIIKINPQLKEITPPVFFNEFPNYILDKFVLKRIEFEEILFAK